MKTKKQVVLDILQHTHTPLSLFAIECRAENYGAIIPAASVRRIVNELDHDLSLDITTTYIRGVKFVSIESGYPKTFGTSNGNAAPRWFGVARGPVSIVPFPASNGSAWGLR